MMWQWDNWCVLVCMRVCIQNGVRGDMIYHVLVGREAEDRAVKSLGLQGQVKGRKGSEC